MFHRQSDMVVSDRDLLLDLFSKRLSRLPVQSVRDMSALGNM